MSPDARSVFHFVIYIYSLVLARGLIGIGGPMPPKRSQGTLEADSEEETPLLRDINALRREMPLPTAQVVVLALLQLCEPIALQSMRPYLNQVCLSIPTT
jgi:hypothetical protein